MEKRATGSFEVRVLPQGSPDTADGVALRRMSLDKQFHGDLEAVSKGEMLTSTTDANGSAVYVAIERVTGTLHDRTGAFVLTHSATRTREGQQLRIAVAPGSATGALAGLTGAMTIEVVDLKHLYEFQYQLPE